jgi:hypothetical protein
MSNAVSLPPKHKSFRPSKFELAVMEFYEILFTYSDETGYQLQTDML